MKTTSYVRAGASVLALAALLAPDHALAGKVKLPPGDNSNFWERWKPANPRRVVAVASKETPRFDPGAMAIVLEVGIVCGTDWNGLFLAPSGCTPDDIKGFVIDDPALANIAPALSAGVTAGTAVVRFMLPVETLVQVKGLTLTDISGQDALGVAVKLPQESVTSWASRIREMQVTPPRWATEHQVKDGWLHLKGAVPAGDDPVLDWVPGMGFRTDESPEAYYSTREPMPSVPDGSTGGNVASSRAPVFASSDGAEPSADAAKSWCVGAGRGYSRSLLTAVGESSFEARCKQVEDKRPQDLQSRFGREWPDIQAGIVGVRRAFHTPPGSLVENPGAFVEVDPSDIQPEESSNATPSPDPGKTDVRYICTDGTPSYGWRYDSWGDLVVSGGPVLEVQNLSKSDCVFHLRGYTFELLSRDGVVPSSRMVWDTALVSSRSTLRLLLLGQKADVPRAHIGVYGDAAARFRPVEVTMPLLPEGWFSYRVEGLRTRGFSIKTALQEALR